MAYGQQGLIHVDNQCLGLRDTHMYSILYNQKFSLISFNSTSDEIKIAGLLKFFEVLAQ